jgi:hypothetical protein
MRDGDGEWSWYCGQAATARPPARPPLGKSAGPQRLVGAGHVAIRHPGRDEKRLLLRQQRGDSGFNRPDFS